MSRVARAVRGLFAWVLQERWLLVVFFAALAVRVHWNVVVHPLGEYVYSDMNGYVQRADRLLDNGLVPHEYSSFFPYGTHWLVAGCKLLFGRENFTAISIVYALIGALGAVFAFAMARRASAFSRWVAPAVGVLAIFYYPQISLGGYILSEIPFSMCLMGAIVCLLRLVDQGRARDAWGMGIFSAFGMTFRPQMLISVALVGVFWLVWRKAMPRVRLVHLVQSAVPIAIGLALSAALMHNNTGRWGLLSENGSFNLVFGRCHNSKIQSLPDGKGHGRVHFRPPSYLQLKNRERDRRRDGKPIDIALNPALGDELVYKGYIGDREKHMEYVRECIAKTGWRGQLEYTYTNAVLLWRYNIPWPDSGRSQWRSITRWWTELHRMYFAIPGLLGGLLALCLGRRALKQGLVALNLIAILFTAGMFFGGIRIRTPYDYVILFLAFEVYALLAWGLFVKLLWGKLLGPRLVARLRQPGGAASGTAGSDGAGLAEGSADAGSDSPRNGGSSAQNNSSS